MIITLCGSTRFEPQFKNYNLRLTLAGHIVFSICAYPSDMGKKIWYDNTQKTIFDRIHFEKISLSEAIVVIAPGNYVGLSTQNEINYAKALGKKIYCAENIPDALPLSELIGA